MASKRKTGIYLWDDESGEPAPFTQQEVNARLEAANDRADQEDAEDEARNKELDALFAGEEVADLDAHGVHGLLALEQSGGHLCGGGGRLNLLLGDLAPAAVLSLKRVDARDLIGAAGDHLLEGFEGGVDLGVGGAEGLEEDGIVDEEVAADAGLFVDDEAGEIACLGDDLVGVIGAAGVILNAAKAEGEDDGEE